MAEAYEEHAKPQEEGLEKVYERFMKENGEPKSMADVGAYLHMIKEAEPRFTGRAIKNVTDAIKMRAMDIELPDEWFAKPEAFMHKGYDEKKAMIEELRGPFSMDMVMQEINRYADCEFRYSDKSDDAAVSKMLRDVQAARARDARDGGAEGEGVVECVSVPSLLPVHGEKVPEGRMRGSARTRHPPSTCALGTFSHEGCSSSELRLTPLIRLPLRQARVRHLLPREQGEKALVADLLRDNELIYGRLLPVSEPHLIERYNKALIAFGLKPTKLTSFDIDRTGFSPQIAEELGDYQYLDPNEVNRRFIILTPDQIDLPVVHTAFSNTGQLVYEFFSKNSRAIDALTIKDVIYGEIEDSVAKVEDIEDLLSINQVEFRVLSAEDVLGKATELATLDRPAEARARRLARRRSADPHGRPRQGVRRHPRERAGAGSGDLPPQRLLDQPFRRHLCVRRSRDDDGDLQSVGAGLPPLAAVAGELHRRQRRRPRLRLPRRKRPHRTAARLVARNLRLSRASRRDGDPRR